MYQNSMMRHIVKYDEPKVGAKSSNSLFQMLLKMFGKKNNTEITQKTLSFQ